LMAGDTAAQGSNRSPRFRAFAALAHPGYRRYYLGQGISLIGTWLQAAAVRWIVYDQTRSAFLLGALEVANLMPGLVVGLFAGAVADRVAPRTMILLMELVQMTLAYLLALLVGLGILAFWQIMLILALARISWTFEAPSRQVLFFDLVGPEILPSAIALNSSLFNATRVIGPALAGIGLAALGATGCFALNGLSFLAAIAAIYSLQLPPKPVSTHAPGINARDLLGGLAYIAGDRRILYHFILMACFGVVGMGYEAMIPAYARSVIGTDVEGYSAIVACGGLGATAGAFTMACLGRMKHKERIVMSGLLVFSFFLGSAAYLPHWVMPSWQPVPRVLAAAICVLGGGFGAALFYSSTQTVIQLAVPPHLRGRVMGMWIIAFSGSVPLGALATGRIASTWSVTGAMGAAALVCAVISIALLTTRVLRGSDDSSRLSAAVEPGHPVERASETIPGPDRSSREPGSRRR
jgi:MFS family permease